MWKGVWEEGVLLGVGLCLWSCCGVREGGMCF